MTRLLIVHYAGDYREADRLRRATGGETYYGHGYVLDQLAAWQAQHEAVGFLCSLAPSYWETLDSGVTVIGADTNPDQDPAPVLALIERFAPTHLIVFGPMLPLIRWGIEHDVRLGVIMADSFANPYYRWVRFRRLPKLLDDRRVTLVANHGANAARALVGIGLRADKVLAWDFPHDRTPETQPCKSRASGPPFTLLFVGSISAKKGVGDMVRAVALLKDRLDVRLDVAGLGATDKFAALATRLGIADRVRFLGLVPNGAIPAMMQDADAVIVPSRHNFPEGLPLTLFEGLASRTPVIASDHPMFRGHLEDGESALVFAAGKPRALADAIARLMTDPALYAHVSQGSAAAWHRMQNPVKWGEMIDRWVRDDAEDRAWLSAHTVAALDGPA
ncbi:glycosyltransferase involved in cell wall biosynthesis [Sphingomonas sp. PP-CE-1A-559]|uniref:glycosyltransferase n=1 Tax=Sphingomonas sp. PP-CE-1A-559 TaxID=2135657 RepID=UPI0010551E67|nr:glycosyltransferase [Sphingomonas sp. PP-CE-1A-559]TCP88589.1 glycosyltransferase involved in cell wall biosynthesis [Sphingomonas sp. PP-CE-1A-559]